MGERGWGEKSADCLLARGGRGYARHRVGGGEGSGTSRTPAFAPPAAALPRLSTS